MRSLSMAKHVLVGYYLTAFRLSTQNCPFIPVRLPSPIYGFQSVRIWMPSLTLITRYFKKKDTFWLAGQPPTLQHQIAYSWTFRSFYIYMEAAILFLVYGKLSKLFCSLCKLHVPMQFILTVLQSVMESKLYLFSLDDSIREMLLDSQQRDIIAYLV